MNFHFDVNILFQVNQAQVVRQDCRLHLVVTDGSFSLRHAVEPVVSRLCKDGDRGPRAACHVRRGDGSSLGLGEGERRGRGELQTQTLGVGDSAHQHHRMLKVHCINAFG